MEALQDFPEDFVQSLQTSFYLLKIFNVRYFTEDQPFLKKYWRFSYITLIIIIHVFTFCIIMPSMLTAEKVTQLSYAIPSILVTIHAVLKSLVLVPKTGQISTFLKELGSLWRVNLTTIQKQKKKSLLRQLNFINRANFWVSVSGSLQYLLSPFFETVFRRFILKQDCELRLAITASYPFNPTENWLIYILVYIFQFYSMVLLITMYSGAALIMISSCALLAIEFVMLKYDLAQVKPTTERQEKHGVARGNGEGLTIEEFVERHQIMLRLSRQLDNVFNGMVFIDLLFVGITTCAFTFMGQFARDPSYMLLSYIGVASSMMTVLYLCYYGELLTRASASIGDTAYENLWYKGGKQYKKAIFLIIKISQKPCCLTSSRYAAVSMKMFTKVVSTTWSYLSLMNSIYSEEPTQTYK